MSDEMLAAFRGRQCRLAELVRRQRAVASDLDSPSLADPLVKLETRVLSDGFTIMVLGEFRRGKSTLINALLGQHVLPAFAWPTTAIISQVKYDAKQRAVLHSLPTKDGTPTPVDVPIDDLVSYVVIDQDNPERDNPYERVEVFWPLDLCREGVEIVDSPGLNEDPVRERVTLGFLQRADAVVFVSDVTIPLSESERLVLEHTLLPLGHEEVFFVYNKINQVPEDQQEQTLHYARQRVRRITSGGNGITVKDERLFFVNARGALESRLRGDEDGVRTSGVAGLEHELMVFLATDRGRTKLLVPARELRHHQARCREQIHERELMYNMELKDLVARYAQQQPRLLAHEQRRAQIEMGLRQGIDDLAHDVEIEAKRFIRDLAARCRAWGRNADLKRRITFNPFRLDRNVSAVTAELCTIISERIQTEFRAWQESTLKPLIEVRIGALESELERDLKQFLEELDQTKVNLTGGTDEVRIDAGHGSATERVLAGVAGVLFGDIGLGALGAMFGARSMVKAALPQLALVVAAIVVGMSPVGILALLLGATAIQSWLRLDRMNADVKEKVAVAIGERLDGTAAERAHELAGGLSARLRGLADDIGAGLRVEISTVREQVEAGIRDHEQGEARVADQRTMLKALTAELDAIEQARSELVEEIASI
jgi:GTPase SAR1 family protein